MIHVLLVIPARYNSSRFQGKPLVSIQGKSMIERVWQQCLKVSLDPVLFSVQVLVATDHMLIAKECERIGAQYYLTSSNHQSGTDRCFEASRLHKSHYDILVNVQGDEPFISPRSIEKLIQFTSESVFPINTLCRLFDSEKESKDINKVKVVKSHRNQALYFSRSRIPFYREDPIGSDPKYYHHIGIYAFKQELVSALEGLKVGYLEQVEGLEQLRWLESGYQIGVATTNASALAVDTPKDLKFVEKFLKQNPDWDEIK